MNNFQLAFGLGTEGQGSLRTPRLQDMLMAKTRDELEAQWPDHRPESLGTRC